MYILVKLVGFHTIMNGLDATGYIMAGFGFRWASEGNLCDKHYSTHQVWPVTTVHSGPAFSSLQPSTTYLPQPQPHWFSHLRQRKEILLICTKARWLKITTWLMKIWAINPGNVPLWWPFNRTHPSLAAINCKWFMSCMTKFPHMRIRHIITAKPWLQFKELIGININFSGSRESCRFQYHLHSLHYMLPYLAAFGPNCYTKSVTLYLENLYTFERKHPEMYTTFLEHGDTVRRSDRLWGWLSLNLCTGHGMMRIIKSSGGLSHCKGVDELQWAIFLLSTYIYEIIRWTPLWVSVKAYLGQRWFAERHQLHRATQSLAAWAFCPNTLTLLLMQRRYLHLLMLIIHKLLGRPSFIAWKAKPWQLSSSREKS